MREELTLKQQKFAQEYLETGNATEAADRVYKPANRATAGAIGSENLTKPNIRAFLAEYAAPAAMKIFKLSQEAENEYVQLAASKDILDRAGYFADKKKVIEATEPYTIRIVEYGSPEEIAMRDETGK
jgi:phage terminase small subunit